MRLTIGLFALLFSTTLVAKADPIVSISTVDYEYGNFSGTIDGSATGSAATLTFDSAIVGGGGNGHRSIAIYFTNENGIVEDILANGPQSDPTFFNDRLTFFGARSGNAALGLTCSASAQIACLRVTGSSQDLTSTIASLNGGYGIYSGGSINVTIQDVLPAAVTPEPSSLVLLGTGLIAVLGSLRRRIAA